jgi:hypothetical protein
MASCAHGNVTLLFIENAVGTRGVVGLHRFPLSDPGRLPHTVVVLTTDGPVTMPWLGSVTVVVQTYFGGQEQGSALADVMWGDASPQGKLTVTHPSRRYRLAWRTRGPASPTRTSSTARA